MEPENDAMDDEDDFTGDYLSNSDQMLAQMGEVARVATTYCSTIIEGGLPAEVAFQMTLDWHKSYWKGVHSAAMDVFEDEFYGHEDEDEDGDGDE